MKAMNDLSIVFAVYGIILTILSTLIESTVIGVGALLILGLGVCAAHYSRTMPSGAPLRGRRGHIS